MIKKTPKKLKKTGPQKSKFRATFWRPAAILSVSVVAIGLAFFWSRQKSAVTLDQNMDTFTHDLTPSSFKPSFQIGVAQSDLIALQNSISQAAFDITKSVLLHLKDAIQKELPCLFGYKVLSWLMSRTPQVQIHVAPTQIMDQEEAGREGAYMPGEIPKNFHPQIQLRADPALLKEKATNLPWIMRNEIFHSICDQANRAKTNDLERRLMPFLNIRGEIDATLQSTYIESIENAGARIARLKYLLRKPFAELVTGEISELAQAERVLQNYIPYVFKINNISKETYAELLRSGKIKKTGDKTYIKQGTIISGVKYPHDLVVTHIHEQNHNIAISYIHDGKSKADIFIKDQYRITNGLHTDKRYSERSRDRWYAEAGSDLEMLDATVKQFFAPEFCQYMGEYTGVGEQEYCSIPNTICRK